MLRIVKRTFPGSFLRLKKAAGRLYGDEVERLTLAHCAARIIAGPFKGMRYIDRANCSALAPKLLGTYERELHPAIESIIARRYRRVIDVGAAEGYYAVGLALRMPASQVHAFDIDDAARANLATLAALNGVQARVAIEGECSHATLDALAGPDSVVICDIEGAEHALLDPQAAAALAACDMLVEIHDGASSTRIHDALAQRFAETHDISFVDYAGRSAADAAMAPWLGHDRNRLIAVDEQRTFGIEWGHFRARRPAAA